MNTGKALWKQTFRVASERFLETHPEWIILQAQSRSEPQTRLELDTKGRLFYRSTSSWPRGLRGSLRI